MSVFNPIHFMLEFWSSQLHIGKIYLGILWKIYLGILWENILRFILKYIYLYPLVHTDKWNNKTAKPEPKITEISSWNSKELSL